MLSPTSLEQRLVLAVAGVVGLALVGLAITLDAIMAKASREAFDYRIAEVAQLAGLLVDGRQGRALDESAIAGIDQTRGATSLQIWNADGSVLARYPAGEADLPQPAARAAPAFRDVDHPGGRRGRLYQAWVKTRVTGPDHLAPVQVAVAVARDRSHLDRRLARRHLYIWIPTVGAIALAAALTTRLIRRSLRRVAALSARIRAIDASSLGERLDVEGLPSELRAPFDRVNELLARVEETLARSRQFNADVSHELRTPLTGLRTLLEVAASRERAPAEYRATLSEGLTMVGQVEAIVENLTLLARLGAGQVSLAVPEPIHLRELVEACFAPHRDLAARRRLRFDNRIAPDLVLSADDLKLRMIAANLLSNAAEYTAEGGWVSVESDPAGGVILAVRDSGPALPEAAVARLFDPFVRLDASRSGGRHFGIGLALVRALCDVLGYAASARNEPDGSVAFVVVARSNGRGARQ